MSHLLEIYSANGRVAVIADGEKATMANKIVIALIPA